MMKRTKTMASMVRCFSLFLLISLSSASPSPSPSPAPAPDSSLTIPPEIHQACKATRFTSTCETTLTHLQSLGNLSQTPEPIEIIKSATWVSTQNLKIARSMMKSIYDSSPSNVNRSSAAKNGLLVLHLSEYRLSLVEEALPRGGIKDARAWSSAALLYQYAAWSSLKYVNDSQLVNETMSFLNSLTELTSNALSMMVSYDLFGNDTTSWRTPMTERDGFWEERQGGCAAAGCGGSTSFRWEALRTLVNATVCKEKGKGCYETVQAAVDAAPAYFNYRPGDRGGVGNNTWFVIRIRKGVYNETVRIPLRRKNVVFVGDGMGKTIITGSRHVGPPGMSTFESATVGVLGDGFMARDLTFKNTAGPDAHQAVAFRSSSDQSIIENCEFLGNQDTLYADSLRQFYNACRIEGNVDFIFGNSASVFQNCKILIRPRQISPEKGENNAITAHGRTDPAQSTGFVFRNCVINGTDEYMKLYAQNPKVHRNYLGRPWKEYSRTVFVDCYMEKLVSPQGWMPWDGDFALPTLYYGESGNSGAGANTSSRVEWSSQIPEDHVRAYSLQNFIQADEWLASSPS